MPARLARRWWAIALRGVVAIVFGILAFVWPGITVTALVLLFGAYALVDGVFAVVAALSGAGQGVPLWALLLEGLAGIAAGILTFLWPGVTELVLLLFIASWAVVTGVLEIIAAIRLRAVLRNEWALVLSGVLSILLGILFFISPITGALVIAYWVGAYAILFGILLLVLAFRLRSWAERGAGTPVQHP
jgi:uncharacterized membrane protein HdeD (DUF308 family)